MRFCRYLLLLFGVRHAHLFVGTKGMSEKEEKLVKEEKHVSDAWADSRSLLEEGRELRARLQQDLDQISRIGEQEIRFRLR